MNLALARRRLAIGAVAGTFLLSGGAAFAKTTDYIDLEAGLGFATNPLLQLNGNSTGFGRISASGVHSWQSERGTTTLSGYVENTTYLKDYGSKQIFDLGAQTSQSISPTVTVYGNANFSGDFAGQLSNRLITVPSGPVIPEPGNPLPPVTTNPNLFAFSGRQYQVNGDVGASIRSGARATISISAGAQHSWFTGQGNNLDFTSYFATGGYSRQVSERTSIGASVEVQRQDFHDGWANIVNPVVTLHSQLSETISADAAVGIMAIDERVGGIKDHQVTPSFSGSLCSSGELTQFCVHVARDAQSSASSRIATATQGAAINTLVSANYSRRLSERDTLQAVLSATRSETPGAFNGAKFSSTYFSAVAGYDRKVGRRIYAGVSGGVRKLFQDGPDPRTDFNASIYVRYRLGDLL